MIRLLRQLKQKLAGTSDVHPSIPSSESKRAILRRIAEEHQCSVFVETGTFLGDTIAYLLPYFDSLISIELSAELAERARRRFEAESKVRIIQGDSAVVLKEVMEQLDQPSMFWLDGHYSHSCTVGDETIETAIGTEPTPILKELDVILRTKTDRHIIVIDDARLFCGRQGYPMISEIETHSRSRGWNGTFTSESDMLVMIP
jgi:hypothetical protein